MVRINKILRDKIMGVENRYRSREGGAVFAELLLGMLFCVLFFAVLIPMMQDMQEDGDSAALELALNVELEKRETRGLLLPDLSGSIWRPEPEIDVIFDAAIQNLADQGITGVTFAAVEVKDEVVIIKRERGSPMTGNYISFLATTGTVGSPLAKVARVFTAAHGVLFALPALFADDTAAAPAPSPGASCDALCCNNGGEIYKVNEPVGHPYCINYAVTLDGPNPDDCSDCAIVSLPLCPAVGSCCAEAGFITETILGACQEVAQQVPLCPVVDCTLCEAWQMCFACKCA